MKRFLDLSLRHKIPLWGSGLIVVATLAVSIGLMVLAFEDLRRDVTVSSQGLGRTLAKTLFPALLHDDLWRAVELVEAPLHGTDENDPLRPKAIFALDPEMRVLVSNTPQSMPLLRELDQTLPEHQALTSALRRADLRQAQTFEFAHSDFLHVTTPILEDERLLGTLVITHSKHGFLPRFFTVALGGAALGALVLAILLPLNWYWGRRMAQPLVQLSRGMNDLVHGTASDLNPELYSYRDELGQLFAAYRDASAALRHKAALEREVLQSERLAAVGRLSAGIAHEVNNPLAGMLMALDNLKQRDQETPPDPHLARTLAFLERGLQHISEIVGALLVEARVQLRPLVRHDFEDVRTLIEPQITKKALALEWQLDLPDSLPLAASLVRQILINLLLNAVQAAPNGGKLRLNGRVANDTLILAVANEGEAPPPEILAHIFEPFVTGREGGHGLGLWVVYQIVQQLGGHIAAGSEDGMTVFQLRLPIAPTPTEIA